MKRYVAVCLGFALSVAIVTAAGCNSKEPEPVQIKGNFKDRMTKDGGPGAKKD